MIKLKLDDLLRLLDTYAERYDEVACFAHDLELPSSNWLWVQTQIEVNGAEASTVIGYRSGDHYLVLRVHEKLGIVVLRTGIDPGEAEKLHYTPVYNVLDYAAQATFGESPETLAKARFEFPVVVLRKRDGKLHRNLMMERRSDENRGPGWFTWFLYNGPLYAWIKRRLWADVQMPSAQPTIEPERHSVSGQEGSVQATDVDVRHPFPSAGAYPERVARLMELTDPFCVGGNDPDRPKSDTRWLLWARRLLETYNALERKHEPCSAPSGSDTDPNKHGGELCVEGTSVKVTWLLAMLADDSPMGDVVGLAENLNLPPDVLRKCLRGLADWIKTQDWTGTETDEAVRFCQSFERKWGGHFARIEAALHLADKQEALESHTTEDRLADVEKAREEDRQQQTAQAGGGFRCPKCKTVFLDTSFPWLPSERGDGSASGWRVTCPECRHEWNCLNFLPSVEDRLADLEKGARQLRGREESRETGEKRAAEKRCGTCFFGTEMRCPLVPVCLPADIHSELGGYRPADNGPAWPDCRFWKAKE